MATTAHRGFAVTPHVDGPLPDPKSADQTGPRAGGTGTEAPAEIQSRVGTARYLLCGALQLCVTLGYVYAMAAALVTGNQWVIGAPQLIGAAGRSVVVGVVMFLALCIVPIVLKWVLIGRWKVQEIPIWSLAYLRFWFVKTLVSFTPMGMFVGTPVYSLFLRALGARVGRNVSIFSPTVPVCTDLLSIGEGTVIRKDVVFNCYRARAGRIQTGTVTLGRNVLIGEKTFLDIDTVMGDDATLGHASSLHSGQRVPAGQTWYGSPAQPTTANYRLLWPARRHRGARRRVSYGCWTVLTGGLLASPLAVIAFAAARAAFLAYDLDPGQPWFWAGLLLASFAILFGGIVAAVLIVAAATRLLNRFITPGKTYPLYGWHYALQRLLVGMTNSKYLLRLSGDSSFVVRYLALVGYHKPNLVQSGSNVGVEIKHDSAHLTTVGSGTMIADGLSILNAEYSNTSFRVSPISIGAKSYFGNNIAYPTGARAGDNCLFGTKTLVPIDGPPREGVGLLGSPPFEIPRFVDRDTAFDELITDEELRRRLPLKNRHNFWTAALFLLTQWADLFAGLLGGWAAWKYLEANETLAVLAMGASLLVFSLALSIVVERASLGFGRLAPLFCSIYDLPFWRHKRHWKLMASAVVPMFNGTPFKPLIWRLLGVRIGRQVFDDGCDITERTLARIGDHSTLNFGSRLQSHSLEEAAFKLDAISVGSDVTIGVGAFIHYGTTIHDGAVVKEDSFLMKGEDVPANSIFGGNPARELPRPANSGRCEDLAASRWPRINPRPRNTQRPGTTGTCKVLGFPLQTWSAMLPPKRLFIVVSGLLAAVSAVSVAALIGTNTPSRTNTVDTPSRNAAKPRPDTQPPGSLSQGEGQTLQSSDNLAKLRSTALGEGKDVRPAITSVKLTKLSTMLSPVDADASWVVRTTKGAPARTAGSTLVPTTVTPVPNVSTPARTTVTPVPVVSTPVPVVSALPVPVVSTPVPNVSTPARTTVTPVPVVSTPVPVVSAPVPVVSTPVPNVSTPARTTVTPVPVVSTPVPVVSAPVPVTEPSLPAEEPPAP